MTVSKEESARTHYAAARELTLSMPLMAQQETSYAVDRERIRARLIPAT